jgi:hypothetical protein
MVYSKDAMWDPQKVVRGMLDCYLGDEDAVPLSYDKTLLAAAKYYLGGISEAKSICGVFCFKEDPTGKYKGVTKETLTIDLLRIARLGGGRLVQRDLTENQRYLVQKYYGTLNAFKEENGLKVNVWRGDPDYSRKVSGVSQKSRKYNAAIPKDMRNKESIDEEFDLISGMLKRIPMKCEVPHLEWTIRRFYGSFGAYLEKRGIKPFGNGGRKPGISNV